MKSAFEINPTNTRNTVQSLLVSRRAEAPSSLVNGGRPLLRTEPSTPNAPVGIESGSIRPKEDTTRKADTQ